MRGRWGLVVPNSRPGGYCSRRGACTRVQIRRSLCGAGGRAANHALARRSSSYALHCGVSYLDRAGVISMLHSVVLESTAPTAG